jgi:hypothetical protein
MKHMVNDEKKNCTFLTKNYFQSRKERLEMGIQIPSAIYATITTVTIHIDRGTFECALLGQQYERENWHSQMHDTTNLS